VAEMEINTYRILAEKVLEKRPRGRPRRRLKDDTKIYLVGIDSEVEQRGR
jgi:hypothetical protein